MVLTEQLPREQWTEPATKGDLELLRSEVRLELLQARTRFWRHVLNGALVGQVVLAGVAVTVALLA
jgi:hypothetical protein